MSEKAATAETTAMVKHGEFCWTEISTNNLDICKNFYTEIFGWRFKAEDTTGSGFEYPEFSIGDAQAMGGMFQISEECYGEKIPPPHFMNYVAVKDVDETAGKAFDLGGKIVMPPTDIPNVGRFCVVQDPTGASISLITVKH